MEQRDQRKEGNPIPLLPHPLALPLLLPAHMHLHRVEGVGCHDPRCHSEHNFVCENGRLRDALSTWETLVLHLFFPLASPVLTT